MALTLFSVTEAVYSNKGPSESRLIAFISSKSSTASMCWLSKAAMNVSFPTSGRCILAPHCIKNFSVSI